MARAAKPRIAVTGGASPAIHLMGEALHLARLGENVLFITAHPRESMAAAVRQCGMPAEADGTLQRIQIRYATSGTALIQLMAAVHLSPVRFGTIVIDDFTVLLSTLRNDCDIARTCALIVEGCAFGPSELVARMCPATPVNTRALLQRWFDLPAVPDGEPLPAPMLTTH